MAEKFEKFTERARKVFSLAQEESQRLNHTYIGTEHLLLGLLREGSGLAAIVLANLGVTLPKAREEIVAIIGLGQGEAAGDPGLTPRAKKVIELSMDEARRLNHAHIGTEHLLLGLVREGEGIAAGVLESLGVSLEKVRQSVMQVVSQSSTYQQSKPQTQEADPSAAATPHPSGVAMYAFAMRGEDFARLSTIAARLNRSVDDLIEEAVRHVWFTEQDEAETSPPE